MCSSHNSHCQAPELIAQKYISILFADNSHSIEILRGGRLSSALLLRYGSRSSRKQLCIVCFKHSKSASRTIHFCCIELKASTLEKIKIETIFHVYTQMEIQICSTPPPSKRAYIYISLTSHRIPSPTTLEHFNCFHRTARQRVFLIYVPFEIYEV